VRHSGDESGAEHTPPRKCHRTIHVFAVLSRLITDVGRAVLCWVYQMDSEFRAFEAPVEATLAGTPLRCPRPMTAQPLVPWTMGRILMAFLVALISAPAQLAPAVINRRRA